MPPGVRRVQQIDPHLAWNALTEQQRTLVIRYLDTGDQRLALREAGYKENLSPNDLWLIFTDPTLDAALNAELIQRVERSAVIAQSVLERVALNEECPWNVRVAAAKELRRPWLEHKLPHMLKDLKDLSDCSIEELRALVAKLEADAGDKAKPILPLAESPIRRRGRPPKRAVPVTLDLDADDLLG